MISKLLRGNPVTAHFDAPGDHAPGKVVSVGDTPFVAINRGVSGQPAAFAAGGGVYEMTANVTATQEPVAGKACYLAADVVTNASVGGKHLGICTYVSGAVCHVVHNPNGTTLTPG